MRLADVNSWIGHTISVWIRKDFVESVVFFVLFYHFETGKTQQQLLVSGMLEADGRFGIVPYSFHFQNFTTAKAFVLDKLSLV